MEFLEKLLESPTLGEHTRVFAEHILHIERLERGLYIIQHNFAFTCFFTSIYLILKYSDKKFPFLYKVYNSPGAKGILYYFIVGGVLYIIYGMYEIIEACKFLSENPISSETRVSYNDPTL